MSPPCREPTDAEFQRARQLIRDLVDRLGWRVSPGNAGWAGAAAVLGTFAALEQPGLIDVLEPYARAAESAARADLDAVAAAGDRDSMVETAVIGMVVGEALTLHLRRMAQETFPPNASSRTPAATQHATEDDTVIIRHRTGRHPLPPVGRSRAPTAVPAGGRDGGSRRGRRSSACWSTTGPSPESRCGPSRSSSQSPLRSTR